MLVCDHCKSCGEEDGISIDKYGRALCMTCYEEMMEVFGIANLVGGTIVIPHTRRAMEFWEELIEENQTK